ncbi:MAG: hypothetical protein KA515_01390 [Candidatus Pacebacteria bacterium]|nr:hypothetical protein [Candidatus Paceibacterota bacterium]
MQFDFLSFVLPSVLMGFGIAVDVTMATLSKFRAPSLGFRSWTGPIAFTHVVFPATGYFVFWGLESQMPWLSPVLGFIGFVLVALFTYEVLCEAVGAEPVFGISEWMSKMMGLREDDSRRVIAILAVSWDALWSGPAKAAQAHAGRWNTLETILSFLVAGVTVLVVAELALMGARLLNRIRFQSVLKMAIFLFVAKFVELSVIDGFGILSLRQGFGGGDIYSSVGYAAIILALVWVGWWSRLFKGAVNEAEEAVS